MNEVAAECCGSCAWFCGELSKYTCHNPEIVKKHQQVVTPESLCLSSYYSPRNPIPIIDIPGVRELVMEAYRDGYDLVGNWTPINQKYITAYMEALEDKDE